MRNALTKYAAQHDLNVKIDRLSDEKALVFQFHKDQTGGMR